MTSEQQTPDSADPVLLDVSEGVATITLNRPEAMNSCTVALKEALRDTVLQVAADPAVRCVVLTGSGRAFCVGQDLKEHLDGLEGDETVPLSTTVAEHYNPTVSALASMPKPVIASLNGVAAGAGASMAFACDFRVLADTAGFNLAFAGIALSCDTGASWTLPRLVGRAKALELLYFPRTLDAATSLELGLATHVVPADDLESTVHDLATRLAAGPTLSLGSIRQSVQFSASHDLDESLAFEAEKMALTGASEDHRRAVHSFMQKEKPVFQGR